MENNLNFLNICLDNARYILQRKKIYSRDIEYLDIVFQLCKKAYIENKTNDGYIQLYSKLLNIQLFMIEKLLTK